MGNKTIVLRDQILEKRIAFILTFFLQRSAGVPAYSVGHIYLLVHTNNICLII
jgi:hypothetical protein